MKEQEPIKKDNKKLEKVAAITLVAILLISVIFIIISFIQTPQLEGAGYTKFFTNVSADTAYDLINYSTNLTIIDCRGLEGCGPCTFKNEGHLEGAVLNSNPETLYNWSEDILVYSKDGVVGADFCQDLINNVNGKLYNLDGGIAAWNKLKYPLIYGSG